MTLKKKFSLSPDFVQIMYIYNIILSIVNHNNPSEQIDCKWFICSALHVFLDVGCRR